MTIQTVNKIIKGNNLGMADAHAHVWIDHKGFRSKIIPASDDFQLIKENLLDFKKNGGDFLIDCTPFGCGRDGNCLYKLSIETGVEIVCVTGFHKRDYYLSSPKIWNFSLPTFALLTIFKIKS